MRLKTFLAAFALSLMVTGCATAPSGPEPSPASRALAQPQQPEPNTRLFEASATVPSPASLVSLTDAQQQAFLADFHSESMRSVPQHHRIRDFLTEKLPGFGYLEQSLTASEALVQHRGNCVSLAALTLALADLVGIEIRFQVMNTTPVFDRDSGILISSNHVRSRLYDPDFDRTPGQLTLQRPHVQIDYFPGDRMTRGEPVSRNGFLAMFYRNLAADELMTENLDQAFALAQQALELDPNHPDSLNLMAVIHRRAGDPITAEAYYQYATRIHPQHLNLLSNYENLLRQLGRSEEAAQIESRLARLDDPNPFHWLDLGERARQRGSLHSALRWYGEALARAPYLHEAYWRQAIVYEELGQRQHSMAALARAHALAQRPEARKNYQAKWHSLKSLNPEIP